MDFNSYVQSLKEATKGKKVQLTFVLGIVTFILGIAPLVISWFVCLRFLVYILGIITLVCAALAVVEKEDYQAQIAKFAAGAVLALIALVLPWIAKVPYYTAKAQYAKSLSDSIEKADLTDSEMEKVMKNSKKETEKFAKATIKLMAKKTASEFGY